MDLYAYSCTLPSTYLINHNRLLMSFFYENAKGTRGTAQLQCIGIPAACSSQIISITFFYVHSGRESKLFTIFILQEQTSYIRENPENPNNNICHICRVQSILQSPRQSTPDLPLWRYIFYVGKSLYTGATLLLRISCNIPTSEHAMQHRAKSCTAKTNAVSSSII